MNGVFGDREGPGRDLFWQILPNPEVEAGSGITGHLFGRDVAISAAIAKVGPRPKINEVICSAKSAARLEINQFT
jgi:hypothetical protein